MSVDKETDPTERKKYPITGTGSGVRDPKKKLVYPANWDQVVPKEVLKRA